MDLKLQGGFGTTRNIVPVVAARPLLLAGSPTIVGEMHINRRSGWRGGPSYQFFPNDYGLKNGFKNATGQSVRKLLREIGEAA